MSWAIGFDDRWQRDIGYGVPAFCDDPKCDEKIDRGLSYVCGGEPYGGDAGCGLYFCEKHLRWCRGNPLCKRCIQRKEPHPPKPDHPEWLHHKATDPSWAEWRATQAPTTNPGANVQSLQARPRLRRKRGMVTMSDANVPAQERVNCKHWRRKGNSLSSTGWTCMDCGADVSIAARIPSPDEAPPSEQAQERRFRCFRKKPVVIEAVRWDGANVDEVLGFILPNGEAIRAPGNGIIITTLEGQMRADPGDWIIKGVKGEFYPCKPDIFDITYSPDEAPTSEQARPAEPDREHQSALNLLCGDHAQIWYTERHLIKVPESGCIVCTQIQQDQELRKQIADLERRLMELQK